MSRQYKAIIARTKTSQVLGTVEIEDDIRLLWVQVVVRDIEVWS